MFAPRYRRVRVKLQIDSAGGNGTARGHGNFAALAAMMLLLYNVELVQQPRCSPMFNIEDLTIWQAIQLEVDKMDVKARHQEPELVKVVKKAWKKMPLVKILRAFEWRRDVASEAIEKGVWCET